MPNRLMTPFCFASVAAAMLLAEGSLADRFPNARAHPHDCAKAPAADVRQQPGRERGRRAAVKARSKTV
ncbi:MAG: hypothetical protein ACO33A_14175 [Hyphomonas sp.]